MRIDPAEHHDMLAALRPRRERRPWLQLLNAILTLAGERATLLSHRETQWASVTFSGTRHTIALEFLDEQGVEAAERFIEALPEHEFAIPHKLIADAAITSVEQISVPRRRLRIEAELLLLDDG